MTGQDFVDEVDCGSFFDHIDDLIEFPSVSDMALNSVDSNDFPSIWANNSDELPVPDPIFSGSHSASALSEELAVPYEDIVQLEWLSTFVEDSFSGGGMTMNKENFSVPKEPSVVVQYQFQSSSPVSVLESSSSSSSSSSCSGGGGGKMIPLSPIHRGPQRARSKRPRPANFNPRSAIELLSENFVGPHEPEQKKKKKMKKPEVQLGPAEENKNHNQNQNQNQSGQGVRKCMHCEITKTPQWRAGPMGPKTLCNACGVRYKSGRLFPEYRPAASPTFVQSLHSNSHKKVVEMRTKFIMPNNKPANVKIALPEPEPELIPNTNPPAEYM